MSLGQNQKCRAESRLPKVKATTVQLLACPHGRLPKLMVVLEAWERDPKFDPTTVKVKPPCVVPGTDGFTTVITGGATDTITLNGAALPLSAVHKAEHHVSNLLLNQASTLQ